MSAPRCPNHQAPPILTKHAPLIDRDEGGRDLHDRQQVALDRAGATSESTDRDAVRRIVAAYLQQMARDELDAVPGAMSDLLALLGDAAAVAMERAAAAAVGAATRDWDGIGHALLGLRRQAELAEQLHPDHDPR